MKRILLLSAVACILASACDCADNEEAPSGRYFGLHCDFHASESEGRTIGATLKEEDIREICDLLDPDFIQVDSKGHPGWASFPSAVGNSITRMNGDPLSVWRKVTAEEGVGLYTHYSGIWDYRYVSEHPEEACMSAGGQRSKSAARANGRYADDLLIPQIKEIAAHGVDGIWIDGDCWGMESDFDPRTVKQFEEETGIDLKGKLPSENGMPYYQEYRDFCRELFRRYVRYYLSEVKKDYPDFKIASNWAFSDHMPEEVCVDVDFLSGDLPDKDSYYWGRFSGRSLEKQGKPWDLMAWEFRNGKTQIPKTAAQLMQEAASVISLGGGFQMYIPQARDGSPQMERIRAVEPLRDFMKARRKWCFGGHLRPQIAVILSTHDRYLESWGLFSRNGGERAFGLVNLLCDAGHSVSIASEHDLRNGGISKYPLIAVPELRYGLEPEIMDMIRKYVEEGGSLLLTGATTCRLFADAGFPASSGTMGDGRVAVIPYDMGLDYTQAALVGTRHMADETVMSLYDPEVRLVSATGLVEICDLEKDGKRLVQLVNANGLHHSPASLTEETIPPVLDVELSIRCDKRPGAIRLQPEGRRLDMKWKDGQAVVTVPRIDFHSVLEIVE